jgi:hypothetical protein
MVKGKPFFLLDIIGSGGSSKVFKVLSKDKNIYALKRIKVDSDNKGHVANYRNEIALLQRLKVTTHDTIQRLNHHFTPAHPHHHHHALSSGQQKCHSAHRQRRGHQEQPHLHGLRVGAMRLGPVFENVQGQFGREQRAVLLAADSGVHQDVPRREGHPLGFEAAQLCLCGGLFEDH